MARIELLKTWRPATGQLFHTGIYRVPADMPADLADRAVREQIAVRAADPAPKRKAKPVLGLKKAPAPENKLQPAAPENKSADAASGD
jgi:hypothetical protein